MLNSKVKSKNLKSKKAIGYQRSAIGSQRFAFCFEFSATYNASLKT